MDRNSQMSKTPSHRKIAGIAGWAAAMVLATACGRSDSSSKGADGGIGLADASFAIPPTAEEHKPGQIVRHTSALVGTVDVTLRLTNPNNPQEYYSGTICIGEVCTSNGATGIYPLGEGVHYILDQSPSWHSTENTTSLGTLTVGPAGEITLGNGQANFTLDEASRTLTVRTTTITIDRAGYLSQYIGFYWFTWGEPSIVLLRNRRYHLIDLYSAGPTGTYAFSDEPDVAIDNEGNVSVIEGAAASFTVNGRTLTAKTTTVNIDANGYRAAYAVGFSDITSGPVHVLLRNRRYGVHDYLSWSATGPYRFSNGPDVEIEDDGDIILTGGAAESFTFDNTNGNHTITAQVVPVGIDKRGYYGSVQVNWFSSGESNLLLKNRRYNIIDNHSGRLTDGALHGFSAPDIAISGGANPVVSFVGDLIDKSFTLENNTLVARLGTITVTRTDGYPDPICFQVTPGCTSAPSPGMGLVLVNRGYDLTPSAGSRLGIRPDGSCTVNSFVSQGHNFAVSCSLALSPAAPGTLRAQIASSSRVELTWSDNSINEAGYQVERRGVGAPTWALVSTCNMGANQLSCADTTNLTRGTTYEYRVRAYNAAGSTYSPSLTLLFDTPAPPTNLVGDAATLTEVALQWSDNSLTEQGFIVERSTDQVAYAEVGRTNPDIRAFTDPNLISDATYHYRVRSYNAIDSSLPTNVATITVGIPGPPSNVQARLVDWFTNVGVVHVTWNDNSGNETGFTVERSSDGGAFVAAGQTGRDAGGPNGGFADWVGPGTHVYRVRAVSTLGASEGVDSPPVSIGPVATPMLTGTVISATRVDLSWTALTNATAATIFRRVDGGVFSPLATLTLPASAYSDMSTTENHAYAYRLDVSNLLGGQSSNVVDASTTAPAAPGLPWAVPATTSSVTIHWAYTPANETGFRVQRSTDGGSSYQTVQSVGRDVRSYTDGGHWEWRTIRYRIVAHHHLDGPPSPVLTVFMQAPSEPSAATAVPLSTSSIRVRWTDNSRTESGFVVTRRTNGGAPVDLVTTALDAQEYVDNSVALGARYTYEVWSVNLFGRSWNGAVAPDVIFQTPNAATGLTATIVSPGQVNLSWTGGSTDATELRLERTAVGASNATTWTLALGATSFSDTTALAGGTYDYRVVSSNALGSNATQPVQVPMLPPAVAPTSLTGVLTSWGTRMDLSWAFTGSQHTRFRLERAVGTGDYAFLANPLASDRAYNDMSVPAGTSLRYRIMAENVIGFGPASNVLEVSLLPASAPSGLLAKVFSGTRIDVSWTDNANNESGYHVQWSTIGGSWENWSVTPELPANTQSYSLTGLSADTTYHVRVFAAASVGASAPSNTDITRTAVVGSTAPAGLTATSQGPAVVGLAWTWGGAVPNENGFEVQRSPLEGTPVWAAIGNADRHQRTYVDRTVQAGVGYQYRVRAFNGISPPSNFSSIASATTPASCTGQADNSECNDGNACTTVDRCQGGVCVGGSPRTCQAGTACATFTCDPADGVCKATNRPLGTPCSDSSLCTTGDVCNGAGVCGGIPKVCSDGNACTTDTCVAATGACQNTASTCAVTPTVCTLTDADLGQVAVFGYSSSATENVEMAYGPDNQMTPTSLQGRQPRWFRAGTQLAAFTLPLNGGSIDWRLGAVTVTASSASAGCSAATRTAARDALQVDVAQSIPALLAPTAVGALRGDVDVTHKGTAVYTLPLDLPSGRLGIEPNLTLTYNSGDNALGHLGVGWSLQGLSVVHRCRRDSARDVDPAPISYQDGDALCLDGERLVQVSSEGGIARYKTERDSYSRITAIGSRFGAAEAFKVQTADGRTLTFGYPGPEHDVPALQARFDINPETLVPEQPQYSQAGIPRQTDPDPPPLPTPVGMNSRIYNWPLTEVRDRFGNYMSVTYDTDAGNVSNGFAFERRLREISYTHRSGLPGRRSVRFEYWSPAETAAKTPADPNPVFAYSGGIKTSVSRLLRWVEVVAPNPVTAAPIRRYHLEYEESPATNRPRLYYVQECDISNICKRRTQFAYSTSSTTFRRVPTSITGEQLSGRTLAEYDDYQFSLWAGISAGDVNGDGRDDIVYRPGGEGRTAESKLHLSNGNGFDSAITVDAGSGYGVPFLLDVTGDGRPELGSFSAAIQGPSTFLNFSQLNLPAFPPAQLQRLSDPAYEVELDGLAPLEFMDVNGDGLIEPMTSDPNGQSYPVLSWRQNVRGIWSPIQQFSPESVLGNPESLISFDLDGDRTTEVLFLTGRNRKLSYRKKLADGSVFFGQTNIPAMHNEMLGSDQDLLRGRTWYLDANGDGLTDVAYFRHSKAAYLGTFSHEMVVQINTGVGFLPPVALMPAGGIGTITNPLYPANAYNKGHQRDDGVRIIDWDGDGAQDILMMDDGAAYADMPSDLAGNRSPMATRPTMRVLRFNRQARLSASSPDTGIRPGAHANGPSGVVHHSCGVQYQCSEGFPLRCRFVSSIGQPVGTIPAGCLADETSYPTAPFGFNTSITLDANGDGLRDLLQYEPDVNAVVLYIREGDKPDLLTNVLDGFGSQMFITYKALADTRLRENVPPNATVEAFYAPNPTCPVDFHCVRGGLWAVDQIHRDNGASGLLTFYSYKDGRASREQQGFLGFRERWEQTRRLESGDVIVSDKRIAYRTFEPLDRGANVQRIYPYRGAPSQIESTVSPRSTGSSFSRRYHRSLVETNLDAQPVADGSYELLDRGSTTSRWFRPSALASQIQLSIVRTTRQPHTLGRVSEEQVQVYDRGQLVQTTTTNVRSWQADDLGDAWLIGQPLRVQATDEVTPGPTGQGTTTRTVDYAYDPTTQFLRQIIREPEGGPNVRLTTTLTDDGTGLVGSVSSSGMSGAISQTRQEVITYDSLEHLYPRTTTNGRGFTRTTVYQPAVDQLAVSRDQNGVVVKYVHDRFGRLRQKDNPDAPLRVGDVFIDYEPGSLEPGVTQTRTRVEGGTTTLVEYDRRGRPVRSHAVVAAGTSVVDTGYDDLGRVRTVTRPYPAGGTSPASTTFNYDELGRPLNVIGPGADGANVVLRRFTYEGLTATMYERQSASVETKRTLEMDARGHVKRSVDDLVTPQGLRQVTAEYQYAPFGLLESVAVRSSPTAASAISTTFRYDVGGRPFEVNDSERGVRVSSFNAFGELLTRTDPAGQTTTTVWDDLGRATSRTASEGQTILTYDAAENGLGALHTATSPDGVVSTRSYDTLGRVSAATTLVGGQNLEFRYEYDATFGRLDQVTYPETPGWPRMRVQNSYRPGTGELMAVTRLDTSAPVWQAQEFDHEGRVIRDTLGSWLRNFRSYDPRTGRLSGLDSDNPANGQVVERLSYGYQDNGNLRHRLDQHNGVFESFEYDSLNRLQTWQSASSTGTPQPDDWQVKYEYDEVGNMLSRVATARDRITQIPKVTQTATYGHGGVANASVNALSSWAIAGGGVPTVSGSFGYDLNRRVSQHPRVGTIDYNSFDLPIRVTGIVNASFGYDAAGSRAYKYERSSLGESVTLYAGGLYEMRILPAGALEHVLHLSVGGRQVGNVTRARASGGALSEQTRFYTRDHLGSVRAAVAGDGSVERKRTDPFGNDVRNVAHPVLETAPLVMSSLQGRTTSGFTGHEHDEQLGLINMRGRIFEPLAARFLSPDPAVSGALDTQAWNARSYVLNRPTVFVDPTGYVVDSPSNPCNAPPWALCGEGSTSPGTSGGSSGESSGQGAGSSTEGDDDFTADDIILDENGNFAGFRGNVMLKDSVAIEPVPASAEASTNSGEQTGGDNGGGGWWLTEGSGWGTRGLIETVTGKSPADRGFWASFQRGMNDVVAAYDKQRPGFMNFNPLDSQTLVGGLLHQGAVTANATMCLAVGCDSDGVIGGKTGARANWQSMVDVAIVVSAVSPVLRGVGRGASGAASGAAGAGPTRLFRIITEMTPEGNVMSNAAKGLPPRGPEIANRAIHNGISMWDSLERAVAKIPVLERAGKRVYGIGEFVRGEGMTVEKTFGAGHYTVTGSTDKFLEFWIQSWFKW